MIHARSDLRGLKIDDHLFRIGGHGRYLPEIDMERSLSIIWLSGCFAIFSGVVVCANAFPSFRLLEIAAMFLSVALIPMAIYAIVFTNIRTALIGITAVAIGLSVWTTNWPAKARFTSAQAKFEMLLAEIENGKTISAPRWVGSYRVQQIDIKKTGAICFWTDLYPIGYSGIVKCQEDKMNFNIWNHIQLTDDWHMIVED